MTDLDRGFFMDPEFDPSDVFEDWEEGFGNGEEHCSFGGLNDENYLFDTYDEVVTEEEQGDVEDLIDFSSNPDAMGMAFALAEEMRDIDDANTQEYSVDENTDTENWEQAMRQNYPITSKNLRPFEKMINDICTGKRSLFKTDDL